MMMTTVTVTLTTQTLVPLLLHSSVDLRPSLGTIHIVPLSPSPPSLVPLPYSSYLRLSFSLRLSLVQRLPQNALCEG